MEEQKGTERAPVMEVNLWSSTNQMLGSTQHLPHYAGGPQNDSPKPFKDF